jgi:Cu-Zn family superoxide dismutase
MHTMKKLFAGKPSDQRVLRPTMMSVAGLLFIAFMLSLTACNTGSKKTDEDQSASEDQTTEAQDAKQMAKASMEAKSGSNVTGEATFTEQDGGKVLFELTTTNLSPGEHAVHLHANGDCSAEDGSSAGGHWNPTMKPHGKRGEGNAFHKGDIGNMTVGNDGKGTMHLEIEGWTIGGADSTNVLGKSVIIHEKADDFTSQPSGNAGSRVSCGVIKEG